MPRHPVTLADLPEHVRKMVRPQLDAQAAAMLAKLRAGEGVKPPLATSYDGGSSTGTPTCTVCGGTPTSGHQIECPKCDKHRETKRPWSAAKRTVVDGIAFPSRMEARVYARLKAELLPGETLLRQVRMPLLSIAPNDCRVPLALTVDFAIFKIALREDGGAWFSIGCKAGWVRWIEAKGLRKSRDWARGKAAFEAVWGKIEEVAR